MCKLAVLSCDNGNLRYSTVMVTVIFVLLCAKLFNVEDDEYNMPRCSEYAVVN